MMNYNNSTTRAATSYQHSPANSNYASDYSDESDATTEQSEESDQDAEQNELFMQEYFHQQYLKMQAIYPPTFKSKVKQQAEVDSDSCYPHISSSSRATTKRRSLSMSACKALPSKNMSPSEKNASHFKTLSFFRRQKKDPVQSPSYNSNPSSQKRSDGRKKHNELSGMILDSLEKLGIVCFDRRSRSPSPQNI
mmetsp:Transcript_6753/g.10041  ORF Transcript_6753/g.10041 Transcript_6753/m.10041 type:complete len:194 (-) Transcript_6753:142-723(-)